jgi:hypothetical protein
MYPVLCGYLESDFNAFKKAENKISIFRTGLWFPEV